MGNDELDSHFHVIVSEDLDQVFGNFVEALAIILKSCVYLARA